MTTMDTLLEEELFQIQEKNLYRKLRVLENSNGVRARFEGKEVLLFCGNDYLGLSHHPRVIDALKQAAQKEGAGSGASRLISGSSQAHADLEKKIAAFKGTESALVYSSGYMANVGALTALAGKEDLIVMDKLCHASIIDGARLSGATVRTFPHKNYKRARQILEKSQGFKNLLLVSETVFSMDGDLADMDALVALKEKYPCLLLVDDAHGTGVLGPQGRGALDGSLLAEKVDGVMGTLSKAVGILGGFVATRSRIVEYLVNTSRPFIFATALPSFMCRAIGESLSVIEEEPLLREKLWHNARSVHAGLLKQGFHLEPLMSPILPVIVGAETEALRISDALRDQQLFVPAIRTPTVAKGQARLRVTVSARHCDEDIQNLLEGFRRAKVN